ncbi:MAG TPA: purine-nucleoside phosphorylase [Acidimicrobiales bacterium]
MDSPYALAQSAADELRARAGVDRFDVAIVLGSGWREGVSVLGEAQHDVATSDLPGFYAPTVPGHGAHVLSMHVGALHVALLTGRVHLYEGRSAAQVVHPVRTLIAAGASTVILTNACGGVDPSLSPGDTVLIRDHLNLTGTSPLEGDAPPQGYGSRFVDLSDLYSARLRERITAHVTGLREGVYLGLRGPHYETPAEIVMARALGASLVGMSTVLEAIAARHLGAEVVGLSLVSNHAAGVVAGPLNHLEVLEAGQRAAPSLGALLAAVLALL